jgi:hypothetical protein
MCVHNHRFQFFMDWATSAFHILGQISQEYVFSQESNKVSRCVMWFQIVGGQWVSLPPAMVRLDWCHNQPFISR